MSKAKGSPKLTIKQERFVVEFPKDWNMTQAALRAGYAKRSARQSGSDNMKNPYILERIRKEIERLQKETGVTSEKVLLELGRIAFSDLTEFMAWSGEGANFYDSAELDEEQRAVISEVQAETTRYYPRDEDAPSEERVKLKVKLYDKLAALDKLARHFGILKDKVDVTHSGEIAITEVEIARPKGEEE